MSTFREPEDIANRGLQHCGAARLSSLTLEDSPQSKEVASVFDKIRQAMLRQDLWRFATKRAILRPYDNATVMFTPATYNAVTAYKQGAITQHPASSGIYWTATADTTGATPGVYPANGILLWEQYFGPLSMDAWNSTNAGYQSGELVYKTPGDGSATVYLSRQAGNTNDPAAVDAWDANMLYNAADVASYNGTNYQSLVNLNVGFTPSSSPTQWTTTVTSATVSNSWISVSSALTKARIVYPISTGPASNTTTRNVFRLPAGYLRKAPTDPKAGINSLWGSSLNIPAEDWVVEGDYIVSGWSDALPLRFVADASDVTKMDPLFCEAFAVAIANAVGPILMAKTWPRLRPGVLEVGRNAMSAARLANGIEIGPIEDYEDDLLTCRY